MGMFDEFNARWTLIGDEPETMSERAIERIALLAQATMYVPSTYRLRAPDETIDIPILDDDDAPTRMGAHASTDPVYVYYADRYTFVSNYDGHSTNVFFARGRVAWIDIECAFFFNLNYGLNDALDASAEGE